MCKTIEDSIFSGSLSYITGIILLLTGQPKYIWAGSFVLTVGSIQWVDAAIWYFKKTMSTRNITLFGILPILILEPIVSYVGYVYYSQKRIIQYEIVLAIFLTAMLYVWISQCKETITDKDGYLKWCGFNYSNIMPNVIYMILIFFPFIFYPDALLRNVILGVGFILWLINVNTDSFGSRWCHSFFVLDIIILGKLFLDYVK